mgnify:CR=1 FL=1
MPQNKLPRIYLNKAADRRLRNGHCWIYSNEIDNSRQPLKVLEQGASVFYVDHHFPGDIPEHENLTAIINESADVCTAALVNGHLNGSHLDWAVTGAFGDNLHNTARTLAKGLDITPQDLTSLENLGTYINYNGYGPTIEDLHFDPEELYRRLYAAEGPLDFVQNSPDFEKLSTGYREDMASAKKCQNGIEKRKQQYTFANHWLRWKSANL